MASKDGRRHRRLPYCGTIRVSWDDGKGQHYAVGKCIDISESGLRIELPVAVPSHATLLIATDRIRFSGSASVKHVVRFGAKYLVGVALNSGLNPKTLDTIREPRALGSTLSV
jgi:hypothetical protein